MKIKFISFYAIAILLVISSCKQDPYSGEYQESYNNWQKFKQSSQNSYKYSVNAGSVFGSNTETVIYVNNGKVIKRTFKATRIEAGSPQKIITKTLDDVYTDAKNNWLKKRDNVKTYFEAKNDGRLSLAGYVKDGCQDDCFIGITIGFISK
jgi:hypothetical protein